MDDKLQDAIVGGIAGAIGLILLAIWPAQALTVLEGFVAIALLGVGIWRLARFAGVDWQAIGRQVSDAMRPRGPSPSAGPACPQCGVATRAGAQFCLQCGAALPQPRVCNGCRKVNLPAAAFCGGCGQPLAPMSAVERT